MNKELFREIGEALYGNQWQTDLARALDVDSRRIREWLSGEKPLPNWMQGELKVLLAENSRNSDKLIVKLISNS